MAVAGRNGRNDAFCESNCILQEILSHFHKSLRILEANEHGTHFSLTVQQHQMHIMGAGTGVVKHY